MFSSFTDLKDWDVREDKFIEAFRCAKSITCIRVKPATLTPLISGVRRYLFYDLLNHGE